VFLLLLANAVSVLLPILISGIFFIVCIKRRWFLFLDRPIDFGLNIFGGNKNWRGALIYILGGTSIVYVLHILQPTQPWIANYYAKDPLWLGVATSSGYVAGELVNSFLKRRLKLAPGAIAQTRAGRTAQSFFDNVDGALASGLVLLYVYRVDSWLLATAFALSIFTHWSTDVVMRRLKLKSQ
jgi:hypothetical protein